MNDQQEKEQYSGVQDQEIRAALDQHSAASDANDFETEHRIYREDAVLDYPAFRRANPRSKQHTEPTCQSAEQKAVCRPTNHWPQ
jgi:ketosteroid isomerase-like protein